MFIIDGKLAKASAFAAAGGVLTFFGLIHSEAIGVGKKPAVAAAYMVVAVFLYACSLKKSHAVAPALEPAHAAA